MAHQFNRLRVRTAVVLLVLLIPFLVLSLIAVDQQRVSAFERAQADATGLIRTITSENLNHLEAAHLLATTLGRLPSVQSREEDSCSAFFAELLQQYHLFLGIYAVNTDTNLGFCSSTQPSRQTDNSSFEWYKRLLATQKFVISNYRIGAVTGKPGVTLAEPVFDAQGKMIAAVGIGLSLEWFNTILQNAILPQDSLVVILDAKGNVLSHNQAPDQLEPGKPFDDTVVREAVLANENGTLEAVNGKGTPYFYTYRSLGQDNGNMRVVIGFSKSVLFAPVYDAQAKTLLVFVGLSIIGLSVAWASSGLLTAPIEQLTKTVQQVTQGKVGELSAVNTSIVELKSLLSAFDGLVAQIKANNEQQVDNLEHVNRQLRREISERTRAQQQTSFLQHLSAAFAKASTTGQVAYSVLEQSTTYLGAASSAFDLLSEPDKQLTRVAIFPDGIEDNQATTHPVVDDILIKQVVSDDKMVWLNTQQALEERLPKLSADGVKAYVVVPVTLNPRTIGVISYIFRDPVDQNDEMLQVLQAMVYQCAQVFERIRLAEEAKEAAKLEERHRFARDLHDSMSQTLFASAVIAESVATQWDRDPAKGQKLLNELNILNRAVMGEMRSLLLELRPEAIVKTGLDALFKQLIDRAQGRGFVNAQLEIIGSAIALPPDVHEAFFRVGQECVNNILKHSQASHCWITLSYREDNVSLSVRDNGQGFDEQSRPMGFGLNNIRERAEAIHAQITVQAAPGQGVQVTLIWPLVPESNAVTT